MRSGNYCKAISLTNLANAMLHQKTSYEKKLVLKDNTCLGTQIRVVWYKQGAGVFQYNTFYNIMNIL